jgi:hypothetical protein
MSSAAQSFEERLKNLRDEPETACKLREGEHEKGTVVDIGTRTTRHNPEGVPVVVLDTGDGLVAVWCIHSVLRSEMAKARPQLGDLLGVKRLRDAERYKRYAVLVERELAPFDWSEVGESGEAEDEAGTPGTEIEEDLF